MARRRKTPETSKITRVSTVAYARKHKPGSDGGGDGDDPGDDTNPELAIKGVPDTPDTIETAPVASGRRADTEPSADAPAPAKRDEVKTEPAGVPQLRPPRAAADDAPAPKTEAAKPDPAAVSSEVWPDSTPRPVRARQDTVAMPVTLPIGLPPPLPVERPVAPPAAPVGATVEEPTRMPNPREIPSGAPDDPALPPGRVPRGDSRSLRREGEFALIYRIQTFVITRFGVVGRRGQWRVVEYPTSASAAHAYAKECSRFVSEGFSDYRD